MKAKTTEVKLNKLQRVKTHVHNLPKHIIIKFPKKTVIKRKRKSKPQVMGTRGPRIRVTEVFPSETASQKTKE